MPLWGNSDNSLTPPGVGGGISQEQMSLFANASNQSGLTGMAMQQVDQITGGLKNEDQVQLLYHLMAVRPNEVSLFFLEYPHFLKELSALIGLIIRKELYAWFSSGVVNATVNAEKAAAAAGYSTITDENIDAQIAKVAPIQDMQQKMHQADNQAMQMMNGHQQQQMMGQMQQQQMYQQQMMQQQMMPGQMPPQRPGLVLSRKLRLKPN